MTHERCPFQKHAPLFRNLILDTLANSPEYAAAVQEYDAILLLADRILAACEQDPEFGRVSLIGEQLETIAALHGKNGDTSDVEQRLLQATELWLKAIVRLTLPSQYAELRAADEDQRSRKFNLFGSIKALGLLTHEELDLRPDEWQKLTDPVRQAIFLAKEDRNPISHEPAPLGYTMRMRTLPGALLTLVAPLFVHRATLRQSLRRLVTNTVPAEIEGIARSVSSERGGHLSTFAGRIEWIRVLKQKLDEDPNIEGGYLLLTAEEGTGKSALCAKLTEALGPGDGTLGVSACRVRRLMPWLPGPVIHFGKSSKDPEEIVRFLLAQINVMVIEPVPFPAGLPFADPASFFRPMLERVQVVDEDCVFGEEAESIQKNRRRSGPNRSFLPVRAAESEFASQMDQFRRTLYHALEVLVEERGPAVLAVDAIEETTIEGSGLAFLPARLPSGVCGLLTGRPGTAVERWARENLNIIEPITLRCLERPEIPLLTAIPDDAAEQITFNDRVFRETAGLPLLVSRVARRVHTDQGSLADISVEGSLNDIFERQANEWFDMGPLGKEVLVLLALYEPVAALNMVMIQDYLSRRTTNVPDMPELKSLLRPVAAQIQGLDVQRVKLAIRPFAEYVRERCFSSRDLQPRLEAIASTLAEAEGLESLTFALFLQFWTSPERPKPLRSVAEGLIEQLIQQKAAERLMEIARPSWKKQDTAPTFSIRCMEAAAELGNAPAMAYFGSALLAGRTLPPNLAEGERWLRKATDLGDERAMAILGNRLLDGDKLTSDPAEGERWLRKAADAQFPAAMRALGNRLLDGDKLTSDPAEGERWLIRNQLHDGGRRFGDRPRKNGGNIPSRRLLGLPF